MFDITPFPHVVFKDTLLLFPGRPIPSLNYFNSLMSYFSAFSLINHILPRLVTFDNAFYRIGNKSEWFIQLNISEWGQFGTMKVGCIIPVTRILTFNVGFLK